MSVTSLYGQLFLKGWRKVDSVQKGSIMLLTAYDSRVRATATDVATKANEEQATFKHKRMLVYMVL